PSFPAPAPVYRPQINPNVSQSTPQSIVVPTAPRQSSSATAPRIPAPVLSSSSGVIRSATSTPGSITGQGVRLQSATTTTLASGASVPTNVVAAIHTAAPQANINNVYHNGFVY